MTATAAEGDDEDDDKKMKITPACSTVTDDRNDRIVIMYITDNVLHQTTALQVTLCRIK